MNNQEQLRLVIDREHSPTPSDITNETAVSLADFGDVLTIEEAAAVLRIGRASAYEAARLWRQTHRDGLPVIRIGRRLLVPRAALERVLEHADIGAALHSPASEPGATDEPGTSQAPR